MSYSVDELFGFEKTEGGVVLINLKDHSATEIVIPEKWGGLPVVRIEHHAFSFADKIKSVVLPKSLEELGDGAFRFCGGLESVIFNSAPKFGEGVFAGCAELPADVTLMSFTSSFDLSAPFDKEDFDKAFGENWMLGENIFNCFSYLRPDVLELAVKHDCFRSVDVSVMLKFLIKLNITERLIFAEEHGMLENAGILNELIEYSVERGRTEITAYLLDLKNRKFGFDGGCGYDLQ